MTEHGNHPEDPRESEHAGGRRGRVTRRRVIGTPAPAEARRLLGKDGGAGGPSAPAPKPRELPADPPNPERAKRAERVVALCFLISLVASIAFIASYVIFQVHTLDKTLRSNLGLGLSMTVAFLALGVGATIWVRHLMPNVELTEERKPLASTAQDRAAFAETFEEGAEASQFVKRPVVRRSLIAASLALGVAPLVLLRDLGPLPRTQLRHTAWRRGSPAGYPGY